jgi:hypothetical protein
VLSRRTLDRQVTTLTGFISRLWRLSPEQQATLPITFPFGFRVSAYLVRSLWWPFVAFAAVDLTSRFLVWLTHRVRAGARNPRTRDQTHEPHWYQRVRLVMPITFLEWAILMPLTRPTLTDAVIGSAIGAVYAAVIYVAWHLRSKAMLIAGYEW